MKTETMLKKLHLDETAFREIRDSVKKAENGTRGEITLAVTAESDSYAFWELFAAVLAAAAVFAAALPFAGKLNMLALHFFWEVPVWYLPLLYGISCFSIILIIFHCVNIPVLDRLIIPRTVLDTCVTQRAFRCFTESGTYNTAEHSGILIFASYLEKQVRIVADSGISAKISRELWTIIADAMAAQLGKGNGKEAFTEAVEKCGELLAEHFPPGDTNPDELPDGLAVVQ
jgi:putative membrane protein